MTIEKSGQIIPSQVRKVKKLLIIYSMNVLNYAQIET